MAIAIQARRNPRNSKFFLKRVRARLATVFTRREEDLRGFGRRTAFARRDEATNLRELECDSFRGRRCRKMDYVPPTRRATVNLYC